MIVEMRASEARNDDATDATRRTRLANERTYLAWWRTGLTSVGVSAAVGKVIPELTGGPSWPYETVGVGFALLGAAFIAYGLRRHRAVDRAVSRGEFVPMDESFATVVAAAGVLLALSTLVLVVFR
jgi:putative membrane protein